MPIPSEAGRQRQRQMQRLRQSGNASICCTARAVDAAQECRNQNFNIVFCLVGGRMGRRPRHRPGHRTQQHQQQPTWSVRLMELLFLAAFDCHSIGPNASPSLRLLILLLLLVVAASVAMLSPQKKKKQHNKHFEELHKKQQLLQRSSLCERTLVFFCWICF